MNRPLYAACPLCGNRAEIKKMIWDWDNDQNIALVKCKCSGKMQQVPYSESRVLKIDFLDPYMHEENNHFDLLVPPGWNEENWRKICNQLCRW